MSGQSQRDLFNSAPIWWEGLTNRQRLFVEYYCTDRECFLNAAAAYIKTHGKNPGKELAPSSIQSNASRMLRNEKIKDAVNRLLRSNQNEDDRLTEYRLLDLLKTLSFYNPKDIIDEYGNLKDMEKLGPLAFCVAGIKKTRNGKEIKLFDRTKAMTVLFHYLKPERAMEGHGVINPVVRLTEKDIESLQEEEAASAATEAEDAEYEVMEGGA